jgi:hypothetical protein
VIAPVQRHGRQRQPAAPRPQLPVPLEEIDEIRRIGAGDLGADDRTAGEVDRERMVLVIEPDDVLAAVVLDPYESERGVVHFRVLAEHPQLDKALRVLGVHSDRGVHLHPVADAFAAGQEAVEQPEPYSDEDATGPDDGLGVGQHIHVRNLRTGVCLPHVDSDARHLMFRAATCPTSRTAGIRDPFASNAPSMIE